MAGSDESSSLRKAREDRGISLYNMTDLDRYEDASRFRYLSDLESHIYRPPYRVYQDLSSQYDIYRKKFYQDSAGRSYLGPLDPADKNDIEYSKEFEDSIRFEAGESDPIDALQEGETPGGVPQEVRDSSREHVRMSKDKFFVPYNDYLILRALYQLKYAVPQQVIMVLRRFKKRHPGVTVAESLDIPTLKKELKRLAELGICYGIRLGNGVFVKSRDESVETSPWAFCLTPTGVRVLRQQGYGGFYDDMFDIASGYKLVHRLNANDLVASLVFCADRFERFDGTAVQAKGVVPLAEMIQPQDFCPCTYSILFKPTEEEKKELERKNSEKDKDKKFHYLMIEPVQDTMESQLTFEEDAEEYYRRIALLVQAYDLTRHKKAYSVGIILFCENRTAMLRMRTELMKLYYRDAKKVQQKWWTANRTKILFTTSHLFARVVFANRENIRNSLIRFERSTMDGEGEQVFALPDDEYTYIK